MQLLPRLCLLVFPPPNLIHHKYNTNDRRTMVRPSLLLLVASASEPRPPPGQTAARRRTPAAFTSVGGRLSGWRAGFGAKCCVRVGRVFLMAQERVSCRFCLFCFYAAVLTPRPCLPRFQANSAAVCWGCWPRKGRSPRYGCRSRLLKVSSVFLLCSSVVMPRSRPVRALPFPFSPTQQ